MRGTSCPGLVGREQMAQMARVETQHLFDRVRGTSVAAREARAATVSDLFFARGDVVPRQLHAAR